MNFIVTLTNPQSHFDRMTGTHTNDAPITKTIEADKFLAEEGLLYFTQAEQEVAAFPMTRVLSVERAKT